MSNKLGQGQLPNLRRKVKVKKDVSPTELCRGAPEMVPRLLPWDDCQAPQVITKAEGHGGGHGKSQKMLTAGSAGEDSPEELAEEEADASAEKVVPC